MVATVGGRLSHMYPTTAGIATLAVFQLGLIMLLRPALSSWLQRRGAWDSATVPPPRRDHLGGLVQEYLQAT